jgi:hypothetical protein
MVAVLEGWLLVCIYELFIYPEQANTQHNTPRQAACLFALCLPS